MQPGPNVQYEKLFQKDEKMVNGEFIEIICHQYITDIQVYRLEVEYALIKRQQMVGYLY